jgi:hypothetical protein
MNFIFIIFIIIFILFLVYNKLSELHEIGRTISNKISEIIIPINENNKELEHFIKDDNFTGIVRFNNLPNNILELIQNNKNLSIEEIKLPTDNLLLDTQNIIIYYIKNKWKLKQKWLFKCNSKYYAPEGLIKVNNAHYELSKLEDNSDNIKMYKIIPSKN